MKHLLPLAALLTVASLAQAQVKIGQNPSVVDAAAVLELENPNKALYLPRVALTSTTDVVTVPAPKSGMLVYNTNASLTSTGTKGTPVSIRRATR